MLDNFRRIDIQWEKATDRIYKSIKVMSSDEAGRKLTVQVLENGKPIDVAGVSLELYWTAQNNKNQGLDSFKIVDEENSIFEMYFTTGLLSNIGELKSNLIIRDLKGVITSNTFYIEVLEGASWDAVESSDSFSVLTEMIEEIKEISSQEEARILKEVERIRNEKTRVSAESIRSDSESERISKESTRKSSEIERVDSESSRKLKETEREESEASRKSTEDVRVSSEESRVLAETAREQFESERKIEEAERQAGELLREGSEAERVSAEQDRVTAESERNELLDLVQQKLKNGEFVGEKGKTGDGLEYAWSGTKLGVRKEGETDYVYADLKGDKGDQGVQGERGPNGPQGADGTMTFEDLTIEQKEGLRGDRGERGPEGPQGPQGPQGEEGPKGDKGDTGEVESLDSSHIVDALGYIPISTTDVPDPTWVNLQNKPTEFNPASHTHDIDDVEGLRAELDSVPELTKENVGLGNVDNVKQASKVEHDQLATDFNEHQADYASFKNNIEAIRSVDGKVELKINGEWVELKGGGGGSSFRLGNVLDLTIEPLVGSKIKITWADPEDIVLEGITLAQWKGTQLRRKLDTYPIDERDGELITNSTTRNQYIDGYLDEDLESGKKYYYALFPYTLDDAYTIDVANRVDAIALEKYEQSPPIKPVVGNLINLKATISSDVGSVVSLNQVDWFASPHEFVDLVENEVYIPYAKFEETNDKWESTVVRGDTFLAINKLPQTPPPTPIISNLEFNKVTVAGISGTEVRLGSGEWLDSPYTFTGLTEETSYIAYARMKETEDKFPSDSSVAKSFTTPTELQLYGFEIDETNSNPKTAVTYIEDAIGMTPASGNDGSFNWGSWEPFVKEISKPVVMKAGVEQYDLNYDDYTKKATGGNSTLTGADGDVFTKLQHLHMRYEKITNGHRWLLASKPFAGSFSMTEELENGYNQFNNPILVTLQNLYLLIFKDRDSQTALGRGRVDGAGYIESGNTNSKGYMFGSTQDLQMKFLGIEDFWGNKFQWVDGLMTDSSRNLLLGTKNFNDTGSGYSRQNTTVSSNLSGYFTKVQGGKGGYTMNDSGGSETTGYADYGSLHAGYLARFGGYQGYESRAGAFGVQVINSASNSNATLSARLCYKNADAVYIGAYLGFEQGSKLRSISGNMPTDTKTISQFRTLAKANN